MGSVGASGVEKSVLGFGGAERAGKWGAESGGCLAWVMPLGDSRPGGREQRVWATRMGVCGVGVRSGRTRALCRGGAQGKFLGPGLTLGEQVPELPALRLRVGRAPGPPSPPRAPSYLGAAARAGGACRASRRGRRWRRGGGAGLRAETARRRGRPAGLRRGLGCAPPAPRPAPPQRRPRPRPAHAPGPGPALAPPTPYSSEPQGTRRRTSLHPSSRAPPRPARRPRCRAQPTTPLWAPNPDLSAPLSPWKLNSTSAPRPPIPSPSLLRTRTPPIAGLPPTGLPGPSQPSCSQDPQGPP